MRGLKVRANARALMVMVLILAPIVLAIVPFSEPHAVSAANDFPTNRPFLYVDPQNVTGAIGAPFTVSVKIFNLTDNVIDLWDPSINRTVLKSLGNLYGFELRFTWDPTIITYVGHSAKIPVEDNPGGVLHKPVIAFAGDGGTVDAAKGTYDIAYASIAPAAAFNNEDLSSTIFTMTFRCLRDGASSLAITATPPSTNVKLAALAQAPDTPEEIIFLMEDGLFYTPGTPFADFSYWPLDGYFAVGKSAQFNASKSYDPDGNVELYMWDFGDGTEQNSTSPIIEHAYSAIGSFRVKLRVLDDSIPPAPSALKEKLVSAISRRDIAVDDIEFPNLVLHGDTVNVTVIVINSGKTAELFQVSLQRNSTPTGGWVLVGERSESLAAEELLGKRVIFEWNTGALPAMIAHYRFLATLTAVPHEANSTNNELQSATLMKITTEQVHDVSITDLEVLVGTAASPFILDEVGDVTFEVVASGTTDETFNATLGLTAPDGTLIGSKEWIGEFVQRYQQKELYFSFDFSVVGNNKIRLNVTIAEEDATPIDNYQEKAIRVVAPPILNIAPIPEEVNVDETLTFDASPSQHQDPDAQITAYRWEIWEPESATPVVFTEPEVDFTLTEVGSWAIYLVATDSLGLTFNPARSATGAYRKIVYVSVLESESSGGIPMEIVYLGIAVVVIVVVGLIVYMRLRSRRVS